MVEYNLKEKVEVTGGTVFVDERFYLTPLMPEMEQQFINLLLGDLSAAKHIFQPMNSDMKIQCLRYIFSYRIFNSSLVSEAVKADYKQSIEETFGSICDVDHHCQNCIFIETAIITLVLYISEVMDMKEFEYIEYHLKPLGKGYDIILQTIKSRLLFHHGF